MIYKTRGIVFRFTRFGETSIIVNIFTDVFGLQSYIVNGVRSKSAKNKIALFQPLTLLDLVVYHREHANMERIKEMRCLHPYVSLATDVRKSAIAMFVAEMLNKTVKHESHSGEIFEFIHHALVTLDAQPTGYENFHLIFLLQLSRYLGFGPQHVHEVTAGRIADEASEGVLASLLQADYTTAVAMTQAQRRTMLELVVKFYADHIDIGEVKSIQVLREVLL